VQHESWHTDAPLSQLDWRTSRGRSDAIMRRCCIRRSRCASCILFVLKPSWRWVCLFRLRQLHPRTSQVRRGQRWSGSACQSQRLDMHSGCHVYKDRIYKSHCM